MNETDRLVAETFRKYMKPTEGRVLWMSEWGQKILGQVRILVEAYVEQVGPGQIVEYEDGARIGRQHFRDRNFWNEVRIAYNEVVSEQSHVS